MRYVLGIDFGRTFIKGGIVSERGKIIKFKKVNSQSQKRKVIVLNIIHGLIENLLKIAKRNKYQITGIGIGFPGPLNAQKGIILSPPHMPGWEKVELKKILEQKYKLPVFINNDANCAILGEQWKGVARGFKNVCMLTLGSGIGGGLILDGKLYEGSKGMGAELGHMSIDKDGEKCGCGNVGCLEAYVSALSLMKQARSVNLNIRSVEDIFMQSQKNNLKAKKIIDKFIKNLGCGIANLINIFNPEIIILGGGMIKALDNTNFRKLIKEVKERSFPILFKNTRIQIAELGDNYAGILGAAKLAFDCFLDSNNLE